MPLLDKISASTFDQNYFWPQEVEFCDGAHTHTHTNEHTDIPDSRPNQVRKQCPCIGDKYLVRLEEKEE